MRASDETMSPRRLLTALPIAIAGAALVAVFMRPQSTPAWIASLSMGALFAGGAAAITATRRLLLVMASELFAVMIGGPLSGGVVVGVQAMVDGRAGFGAFVAGTAIFFAAGVTFGALLTIPIGLVFAALCTGWAAVARKLTRPS